MIRILENYNGGDLRESHYSSVIRAHLAAYGTGYDFCRFYEICHRRRIGVISVFNSAVTADFTGSGKITHEVKREIAEFIDFQLPLSIEMPHEFLLRQGFSGYASCERAFFTVPPAASAVGIFEPEPENVFKTVYGENGDYGLWLTDTMRRVNNGLSRLYGYESAVLTVRFTVGGRAYITDVATQEGDRGKGYARTLLGGVAKLLSDEGLSSYLTARSETSGYYRSLGYPETGADRVFDLKGEA